MYVSLQFPFNKNGQIVNNKIFRGISGTIQTRVTGNLEYGFVFIVGSNQQESLATLLAR